jgi:transcriptional regulator CtsR
MDSLDNPERHFGHFNKSSLVNISLTTIKNISAKKTAKELEDTANNLFSKQIIKEKELEVIKKMIENGVADNYKLQGVPA